MPSVEVHRKCAYQHCGRIGLLIVLILVLCYANTFTADWQMDDRPNILHNKHLHIDNLNPTALWDTLFANPGAEGKMYRPTAMFSFALNWWVGQDDPVGYHMVNLGIHCVNALLVYLLILRLLAAPAICGRHGADDAGFIAVLGALLWALNPVQTQAVTYVVQRMALMAAMFYLLGLLSFLAARMGNQPRRRIVFSLATLVCCILAVGSKENAILLPISLILVEWLFFRPTRKMPEQRRNFYRIMIAGGLIFMAMLAAFVLSGRLNFLFDGYLDRPFNMSERLMTQSRIVIWYLSLLVYPAPFRLSVEHDVEVSTSLLNPWTTLPSMLLFAAIVIFALRRKDKNTLLSYGLLFFFLNQAVESTILPLELIFEHRNYLPSCFLFMPMAAGMKHLLDRYRDNNRPLFFLLTACLPLMFFFLGIGTYYRNQAWSTEQSLWQDAMQKAPHSARPRSKLAELAVEETNPSSDQLNRALRLYFESLNLRMARKNIQAGVLANMANIYVKKNDVDAAITMHRRALQLDPDYIRSRYDLAVLLSAKGQWNTAAEEIDKILAKGIISQDYYNLKGLIRLWQNRPDEALLEFRKSIRLQGDKAKAFLGAGAALSALGYYPKADWFMRLAHNGQPDSIMIVFGLIDNAVRAGNAQKAGVWADYLLREHTLQEIGGWLALLPTFHQAPPISTSRITPPIIERAQVLADGRERFGDGS
jgi:tetratricopeptide (TPR) repeat protein